MGINDLYEASNDIMEAVNDAIKRNDYADLSASIAKTVEEVTEALRRDVRDSGIDYAGGQDVRRRVYRGTGGQRNMSDEDADIYRRYRSTASRVRRQAYGGRATRAGAQPAPEQRRKFSGAKSFFFQKNITKSNGIGQIVAGGIGLLFSLPAVLSNAVGLIVGGGGFGVAFGLLASALIAAASAYLLVKGRRESELVDRYRQYGTAIGKAEYIELEKLARATGRTKQEVRDDLQKMIDKGFLKEAWIDDQGTTLMLSEDVYNQYQNLKTERAARLQQEEQVLSEDADLPQEAQQILREGRAYIQTIHQFNKEIPGEEMSSKLDQLENTMLRIVEQVRKQPSCASDLRKLMNYYLPTTVKLLSAYCELDRQTVKGDNIVKTKREIEDALDTINNAFENLLDSMFQEMAWDVSSDISVMETMFAQDGLTDDRMSVESGQTAEQMEQQVYGASVAQAVGQAQTASQAQTATQGQAQTAGQVQTEGGVQMQAGGSTLVWGDTEAEE